MFDKTGGLFWGITQENPAASSISLGFIQVGNKHKHIRSTHPFTHNYLFKLPKIAQIALYFSLRYPNKQCERTVMFMLSYMLLISKNTFKRSDTILFWHSNVKRC